MRIKLLAALMGTMLLASSCSREPADDTLLTSEDMQLVTFGIQSFDQSITAMSASRAANVTLDEGKIERLVYTVYKKTSSGYNDSNLPKGTFYSKDGSLPQTLSFMLPKGEYRIITHAFGATEKRASNTELVQPEGGAFYINSAATTYASGYAMNADVYLAAADFILVGEFTPQTLTLKRIVGRLDIVFENGFTAETDKIKFTGMSNSYVGTYSFPTIATPTLSKRQGDFSLTLSVNDMKTTKEGYPMVSMYFFGEDVAEGTAQHLMNITINAYSATNSTTPLGSVYLRNEATFAGIVPIYRSKVTTVKGKMFGENVKFQIGVENEDWTDVAGGPIEF